MSYTFVLSINPNRIILYWSVVGNLYFW